MGTQELALSIKRSTEHGQEGMGPICPRSSFKIYNANLKKTNRVRDTVVPKEDRQKAERGQGLQL